MVEGLTLFPILGILPALFWLGFFLLEDRRRPEPKGLVLKVFMAGALSAILAVYIQLLTKRYFSSLEIIEFSLISLISFAFIEELLKFLAAFLSVRKSRAFDEPIDGMVYMITAAMGFAALENILFLFNNPAVFEITMLRFVGATLVHALASGFVGFYWMKGKLLKGLLIATLLHTGFNYLILQLPGAEIYATLLLIAAAFFLFYDFDLIKEEFKKVR